MKSGGVNWRKFLPEAVSMNLASHPQNSRDVCLGLTFTVPSTTITSAAHWLM